MNHARIEKHTAVLGVKQGYKPLYVRETPVIDPTTKVKTLLHETAWTPTPHELELLNRGATIHVALLAAGHPPIKVTVGPTPDEGQGT